jgi:hypothetical protein
VASSSSGSSGSNDSSGSSSSRRQSGVQAIEHLAFPALDHGLVQRPERERLEPVVRVRLAARAQVPGERPVQLGRAHARLQPGQRLRHRGVVRRALGFATQFHGGEFSAAVS